MSGQYLLRTKKGLPSLDKRRQTMSIAVPLLLTPVRYRSPP